MSEEKVIRITCRGADTINFHKIEPFQGELKEMDPEDFEKLKTEILENGFNSPIHIYKTKKKYHNLDGHQRVIMCCWFEDNGWTVPDVPIDYIEAKSLKHAKHILLTRVGQYGKVKARGLYDYLQDAGITVEHAVEKFRMPDIDMEKFQVKFFIDPEKQEKRKKIEDSVPNKAKRRAKPGDLWILGKHKLLCGDATNVEHVEKLMDKQKADMVFTDPPYGINFGYNSYNDSEENWYELIDGVMPIAKQFSNFIIMPCCRIVSLKWWYENHTPDWIMCWYKGSPGHRSKIGFNDWEPHLVWGRPKNQIHDYWQTACGFKQEGDKHSCPKPVEYSEWAISRAIDNNDIVLDFFGGSGSTMIASEKTNRKCYMMEIDPRYCDVILERWEKYTGKKAQKFVLRKDGKK